MDEYFAYFLEEFGSPISKVEPTEEQIASFRGKLPDQLLDYWRSVGFSSFKDGLFSIVNPTEYEAAKEAWIGDTPLPKQDKFHVIARTGFGNLFLWGEKTGFKYEITPTLGLIIQKEGMTDLIAEGRANFAVQVFFSARSPDADDIEDGNNRPLFSQAVKKFGPLGKDEVFAFEPTISLGGPSKIENIKKRDVHVYLSLLADLGRRELVTTDEMMRRSGLRGS